MNEDFKVLLKVEVDPSSLSSIDDKIKNAIKEKVKIKADLSNLKEVESELDKIANKIRSVNKLKVDINGSVDTKASNINSKATNNSSTIKTETKQVNELTAAYRELKSLMTQASKYELKRLGLDKDSQEAKILNQQLGEIGKRISDINKKYESSFSEAQSKSLAKIREDANNAVELKQAKLADKYAKQAEQAKRVADAYKGIDRVELSNRIQTWMNRNSNAAKDYFEDLQRIQQELKECDDVQLGNLAQQFKRITSEASAQGKTGLTFFDRFKSKMAELTTYFSAIDVMHGASNVVREMAQNVLSVDTAMTELYRVTDLTKAQYDSLYKTMTADAKEYGTQLDTLINATASWTRLGFDANTAEKLASVTAMYQHVTDLDEKTATENLVTAYKAYQDQLLEITGGDEVKAIEKVADIFDNMGGKLALRELYRLKSRDGQDRGKTKHLLYSMGIEMKGGVEYRKTG